jgi:UDP:flavonoid glycosyltransferase YjiC (YdhE family)
MRVLLTWELGLNLGHLTRLLPIAQRLLRDGHSVLVAARDVRTAASLLGPTGIRFVQAPYLPSGIPLPHRASGYADILLSQGWSDEAALWGLVQAWLSIFHLFRPDKLVLDYSPTVSLAGSIAGIPSISVGNGFELPPLTDPLPAFPGFSWATAERAASAESKAMRSANAVLRAFGSNELGALRDVLVGHARILATFRELDHYGPRKEGFYVGPLLGEVAGRSLEWPRGDGPKIFASLTPRTRRFSEIFTAFKEMPARVVCVARGFTPSQLSALSGRNIRCEAQPVKLSSLLDADLCITYGAEGTMLTYLMARVPQLVIPWHVETYMMVRRLEALGVGGALRGEFSSSIVRSAITSLAATSKQAQGWDFFTGGHATEAAVCRVVDSLHDSGWRSKAELRVHTNAAVRCAPVPARKEGPDARP